jgi:hypothetical protein
MKSVLFCLPVFLLSSCHFSAGIKKDALTGLTIKNQSLDYEQYTLLKEKRQLGGHALAFGETLTLTLTGVSHFKEEDGKVYPGMRMTVKKKSGEVLLYYADLLQESAANGLSRATASTLRASFTAGPPLVTGQSCDLVVTIWDKKGDGTITASLPLTIEKPVTPGLSVTPSGLSCDFAYITDVNGKVSSNEAVTGDRTGITFFGLKGFTEENGLVFPGGEIIITGTNGEQKLHTEDVFATSAANGLDPAEVARSVRLSLETLPAQKGDESLWTFRVWDKKSDASIQASMLLKLR